jgi:hypothetical protein
MHKDNAQCKMCKCKRANAKEQMQKSKCKRANAKEQMQKSKCKMKKNN